MKTLRMVHLPYGVMPGWDIETAFWRRVTQTETCWLWTGPIIKNPRVGGYGIMQVCVTSPRGPAWRRERAHKIAYEMFVGPVPDGRLLRHTCDTRRCVRPDHLVAGTQLANVADMVTRGRMARGSRRGHARLTEDQVREARDQWAHEPHRKRWQSGGVTVGDLATRYGVSRPTMSLILRGLTWQHISG